MHLNAHYTNNDWYRLSAIFYVVYGISYIIIISYISHNLWTVF